MSEKQNRRKKVENIIKQNSSISKKQVAFIIVGILMIAAAIHFFLLPSNLSLGGATGLALILAKLLPLDTGPLLLIVNAVLFVIGFILIGNKFGFLTVISTLALSGAVWLLEVLVPMNEPIVQNTFLNLVVAVLIYGIGVGFVLNQGASTGGSDIIAKVLYKYFGLDLGKGCLVTDFLITLAVGFTYGVEIALFCLIGVIMNGLIIDYTIDGLTAGKLCFIATDHPKDVSTFLILLGRSATIYEATGAYTMSKRTIVQTVVTNRDFIKLKNHLKDLDQNAFMIVTSAHQVFGFHWKSFDD